MFFSEIYNGRQQTPANQTVTSECFCEKAGTASAAPARPPPHAAEASPDLLIENHGHLTAFTLVHQRERLGSMVQSESVRHQFLGMDPPADNAILALSLQVPDIQAWLI